MKNAEKIILAFRERIGEGKQFATENALAQYLGLGNTRHTKLYDFLEGSDTRYKSVCHWLDLMGWTINTGSTDDVCPPGDIDKLQAENAVLRAQVADLSSQLKFAEKILLRPEPKEKAPVEEASAKDAEFYLSNGTEGE